MSHGWQGIMAHKKGAHVTSKVSRKFEALAKKAKEAFEARALGQRIRIQIGSCPSDPKWECGSSELNSLLLSRFLREREEGKQRQPQWRFTCRKRRSTGGFVIVEKCTRSKTGALVLAAKNCATSAWTISTSNLSGNSRFSVQRTRNIY